MVEENRSRQQIISDNIVYYIKKNNMRQVDFYTSLNINKQDFSKKKNNKGSSFSTDEIYIAAKTLNVTVNDLYYSEEEKKEISVL
jgi:predicted XRE-type DNA-binding protein